MRGANRGGELEMVASSVPACSAGADVASNETGRACSTSKARIIGFRLMLDRARRLKLRDRAVFR